MGTTANKNIFIIHGKDELNAQILYEYLKTELKLNPVSLSLKPGKRMKQADKFFFDSSSCAFAFAVFSRDDKIYKDQEKYLPGKPNVVFTADWFELNLEKDQVAIVLMYGSKIDESLNDVKKIYYSEDINDAKEEIYDALQNLGLTGKSDQQKNEGGENEFSEE